MILLDTLYMVKKTDWIPRIKHILDPSRTDTFEPFDRFAQFENSKGKTIDILLEEFSMLRAENVQTLKALAITSEDLLKEGTHPDLGTATLKNLIATWIAHDLGHIHQITRVMAKGLQNDIGPWKAYLKVMHV